MSMNSTQRMAVSARHHALRSQDESSGAERESQSAKSQQASDA